MNMQKLPMRNGVGVIILNNENIAARKRKVQIFSTYIILLNAKDKGRSKNRITAYKEEV